MRSIFLARCWLRPVSVFSSWGSEARPITSGLELVLIEIVSALLLGWVLIRRQADSSGAGAADRPVSQAAFRAVHCYRGLLVCGAGSGFRLPAVLLRGHSWPVAGRDRLFHDALASCCGHHGADRRTSVRPLSRRAFSAASVLRCSASGWPCWRCFRQARMSPTSSGGWPSADVDLAFSRRRT